VLLPYTAFWELSAISRLDVETTPSVRRRGAQDTFGNQKRFRSIFKKNIERLYQCGALSVTCLMSASFNREILIFQILQIEKYFINTISLYLQEFK